MHTSEVEKVSRSLSERVFNQEIVSFRLRCVRAGEAKLREGARGVLFLMPGVANKRYPSLLLLRPPEERCAASPPLLYKGKGDPDPAHRSTARSCAPGPG